MNEQPKQEALNPEIIPSSALENTIRAETDVAINTAKRYPMHSSAGDVKRFQYEAIAMATVTAETAQSCLYSLPRGGKSLQGPSVRLAEIAASAFGNIKTASRIIETSETEVVAQGVCHDLERNVTTSCEVRRKITGKRGRFNDDMIIVTSNAAASIALRNAIFKVVPAALIEPVYQAARTKAFGGVDTIQVRQVKCVDRFGVMGITEERVLAKMQRPAVSDLTKDDLSELIGFFNAIQGKETTPEDCFPAIKGETDKGGS